MVCLRRENTSFRSKTLVSTGKTLVFNEVSSRANAYWQQTLVSTAEINLFLCRWTFVSYHETKVLQRGTFAFTGKQTLGCNPTVKNVPLGPLEPLDDWILEVLEAPFFFTVHLVHFLKSNSSSSSAGAKQLHRNRPEWIAERALVLYGSFHSQQKYLVNVRKIKEYQRIANAGMYCTPSQLGENADRIRAMGKYTLDKSFRPIQS